MHGFPLLFAGLIVILSWYSMAQILSQSLECTARADKSRMLHCFSTHLRASPARIFRVTENVARRHERLSRFLRDRRGRSLSTHQTARLV